MLTLFSTGSLLNVGPVQPQRSWPWMLSFCCCKEALSQERTQASEECRLLSEDGGHREESLKTSGSVAVRAGSFGYLALCPLVLGGKQRLKVPIFTFCPLTTDKESLLDKTLVRQALLNPLLNSALTFGLLCSSLHCLILARILSQFSQNPPSFISEYPPCLIGFLIPHHPPGDV